MTQQEVATLIMESGFSFKNLRGEYYIEDDLIKYHNEIDFIDVYEDISNPMMQSLFLTFVSVDANNDEDILGFCSKYGRLGLYDKRKGEECLGDASWAGVGNEYGYYNETAYAGYEMASDYRNAIRVMQTLIEIRGFVEAGAYVNALRAYIKLNCMGIFINPDTYGEFSPFLMMHPTEDWIYHDLFEQFSHIFTDLNFYDKGGNLIVHFRDFCQYDPVKHDIIFRGECDLASIVEHFSADSLTTLFWSEALDIINYYIGKVTPAMHLVSHEARGFWKAPTLLSAMYMELFLYFSLNEKVRRCKNKTCSDYFKIIGNDTRKIYCCEACAKLEAKRMQRAREKARKQADNKRGASIEKETPEKIDISVK